MESSSRIRVLDSLRGTAAYIVVIFHCLVSHPVFYLAYYEQQYSNSLIKILTESPLHTLWAGPEMVLLFFILSGYVLAISYLKYEHVCYSAYIVKRLCRIYIPYLAVMLLYIAVVSLLGDYSDITALSETFNSRWDHPIALKEILSYVFMLGYDSSNLNGVIWSLIHEMRISIIFPVIILLVKKLDLKRALFFGLGTSLSLYLLVNQVSGLFQDALIYAFLVSMRDTCYYCTFFIFGAVLAKNTGKIQALLQPKGPVIKFLLVVLSLVLINFKWIMNGLYTYLTAYSSVIRSSLLGEWIIALGVLILFAVVLSSPKLDLLLSHSVFGHLGKLSYSIYLVHMMVIMLSVKYLSAILPLRMTVLLPLVLVLPTALLIYRFIEKPAMNLGLHLAKQIMTKPKIRLHLPVSRILNIEKKIVKVAIKRLRHGIF